MKRKGRMLLSILLFGLGLSGCSKNTAAMDGGIIRIAYNQAPTHPHYQALEKAGEKFQEATGGRYEFLIYPNEVLGDQRASIELIQNGAIQMAIVNNAMIENYNKDFAILGLPYIFDSEEHQKEVFTSGVLDPLFSSTKEQGFQIMAAYTAGSRNVYASKAIETPADLSGMKIRVMESPSMIRMMEYMGGVGTPMGQGEVYTAIQQGVIDGGENNEITYSDMKHYEVAPFFSRTQHIMIPDLVIAESAYLDRMAPEDRELLVQILQDSIEEEFALWDSQIEETKNILIEKGVTFVDVDIAPFQENCLKLHDEAIQDSDAARELYQQIRALAQ